MFLCCIIPFAPEKAQDPTVLTTVETTVPTTVGKKVEDSGVLPISGLASGSNAVRDYRRGLLLPHWHASTPMHKQIRSPLAP